MRQYSTSPYGMISILWGNRQLIKTLAKRDILSRYRGSFLGLFWSLLNPLFMLTVYTFVFSEVFKARWNAESDSKVEFALILFAGLIVFNLFSECISRAPNLVIAHPNYVKKVVFPLEILPIVDLLTAGYHALVSLLVWLVAYTFLFGVPHKTVLVLPLVAVPFCFFILGISWLLASLGVFLRDISQIIGAVITVLMFLSPLFYPASALPYKYQYLFQFNPLAQAIEQTRDILFRGEIPGVDSLAAYWGITFLISWLGFLCFQKTRAGFADAI